MEKAMVFGIIMVALLAANRVQADVCEIINGSFEDDGWINDITVKEPNGWDVNVPAGEFLGYVHRDWPTEGIYNLTLYTDYYNTFEVNDMATVSQGLNLTDVNEIIFDLKLQTDSLTWDPSKVRAIVLIDDDIVWNSNNLSSGVYYNRIYTVEDKYRDGNLHKFALGIKVKVAGRLWRTYYTHWDFIECTGFCGGGGLLAGDFDRNCFVDINDLKSMAEVWLDELALDDRHNLFHDDDIIESSGGIVSFLDFAVFADSWDGDLADLQWLVEKWLQQVGLDDEHNLFKGDDVQAGGIINFFDFAIFADNWLASSYE